MSTDERCGITAIDKPQEPPRYFGYFRYKYGGYAQITECESCYNTGLYEDCPTIDCCKHCGGRVRGQCGSGKWIAPVETGYLWWKKIIQPGYWLKSK